MSYDCKVDIDGLNNCHRLADTEKILNTGGYIIDPLPSCAKDEIVSSGPSPSSSLSSGSIGHLATLHETELKDGTTPGTLVHVEAGLSPTTKSEQQKKGLKLKTVWDCCRHTYYATLTALLILVGCPMAAVGSQEGVDWALYIGIVMVLCAFLISLFAPNVRSFINFAFPNRLRHARGLGLQTIRKIRVKSTTEPT